MGEEVREWQTIWGAKVKTPVEFPDDILKDAITKVTKELDACENFELNGNSVVQKIKEHMDTNWSPHWCCFIGRNFGSKVSHESRRFIFFYHNDKAVMLYKIG